MNLTELIIDRRSIQLYEDRPVPVEELKKMLETAVWVPNHKMTQPWRFIFVYGDSIKKIAEINRTLGEKGKDPEERKANGEKAYQKIANVPVLLVVAMKENHSPKFREEDYAATSCMIQNFSLLAWEQGIGMIWKTGQLTIEDEFREAVGVQPGERVAGMLQIGYPAKVPKPRPRADVKTRITELD
ncbi:nitroreductase family protein [Sediminibacillus albus]|uniref:Putative NAD(P)H nitroreductase n=1 Tax=Sediminibacillus albus TaxID=407036 RepID=A0A1G8ZTP7_9BACI|nr:nitroreductase [Sediminibacillus albus]SDK18502.1 Nitroreductase [Sediminibacillus albus]